MSSFVMSKAISLILVTFGVFGFCTLSSTSSSAALVSEDLPVTVDSRIKTFMYNETEVFPVTFAYGYRSYIEFGEGESVKTVAIGNNVAWRAESIGRKLFIMPLEEKGFTNMVVITSKRTYVFDMHVISGAIDESGSVKNVNVDGGINPKLAYVVRFFYPSDSEESPNALINNSQNMTQDIIPSEKESSSYQYFPSDQASAKMSPLEFFDDGKLTYMRFRKDFLPSVIKAKDVNGVDKDITEVLSLGNYSIIKGVYRSVTCIKGNMKIRILNLTLDHGAAS